MNYEAQQKFITESSEYLRDDENYAFKNSLYKKCKRCRVENFIICDDSCIVKYKKTAINDNSDTKSTKPIYQETLDKNVGLHLAVLLNKPRVVQQLLHRGTDVNMCDSKNYTALHLASEVGSEEIMQLLLVHGAKVNDVNDEGNTPLTIATLYDHVDVFHCLMKHGADINQCNQKMKETVLHVASTKKHELLFKIALDYGADVNAVDKNGYTSLNNVIYDIIGQENNEKCYASRESQLFETKKSVESCLNAEMVNRVIKLLEHGAKVEGNDSHGQTPLNLIVSNFGCVHVLKALLDYGGEINKLNYLGDAPLHTALRDRMAFENNRNCYLSQESQKANVEFTNLCQNEGRKKIVVELLKNGANANLMNTYGETPLHVTIQNNGCKHLIKILLEYGANANAMDKYGDPLLCYVNAVVSLNPMNSKRCENREALMLTTSRDVVGDCQHFNQIITAREFLKNGARVDSKNNLGETPLHIAIISSGCKHLIQILLDYGADVNATNLNGMSPLEMEMLLNGLRFEVILLLMIYGANYNFLLTNNRFTKNNDLMSVIGLFRIAMSMAGLSNNFYEGVIFPPVNKKILEVFQAYCRKELNELETMQVGNVTAMMFLRINRQDLVNIFSKDKVTTLLEIMPEIINQYPIYGSILRRNFGYLCRLYEL